MQVLALAGWLVGWLVGYITERQTLVSFHTMILSCLIHSLPCLF